MMTTSEVVLVNEYDETIGTLEKLQAHKEGNLHRAVSVVILNSKNEMLLQRRAATKYHSAGLWTNAACTHPSLNELPKTAASRRLKEEMGIDSNLNFAFKFIYYAVLDNGMIEHELDYVYFGKTDVEPILNKDEADNFKYMSMPALQNDIENNAAQYTEWFKILLPKLTVTLNEKYTNCWA